MSGYQADIGEGYWGSLYDESRRNKVLVPASEEALKALNKTDWNHYVVRAIGDKITLSLNGKNSVDYHETDPSIARSGLLAVQIHAGGPMEVQFKDMMIQPLPIPTADDLDRAGLPPADCQADDGERKYTVYVPEGYDGTEGVPGDPVPARRGRARGGRDRAGPGRASARRSSTGRDGVPAIVVFPRPARPGRPARPTATAALAALDDVMAHFASRPAARDPDRAVDGRQRELVARRRAARAVRRRRADLRARQARGCRQAQGLARLVVLRRRRPRPRPSSTCGRWSRP